MEQGYIKMEHMWKIRVWGVRGSTPVPGADFLKYGGNTACISVDCGTGLVVFDAGSGLSCLGRALSQSGRKRIDILLGHLHIDHCLGLFGFKPLLDKEAEIHIYGMGENGAPLQKQLEALLGPPYWPLGLQDFPAHVEVHDVKPDSIFKLVKAEEGGNDLQVHTLAGKHPNGSLLYGLRSAGKSIIHALDCEMDDEIFDKLRDFSHGADLLIWDANFTEEDLSRARGWGHSCWKQGIALRQAAGVKKALMTHYSSEYTDAFMQEQERLAKLTDAFCCFAREGMEIKI